MLIEEVNNKNRCVAGANQYKEAINKYGYAFHKVKDQILGDVYFYATQKGAVIIDSRLRAFYICDAEKHYEVKSIAIPIDEEDWNAIIKNHNSEGDFKNTSQRIRIENIVDLCFQTSL